nr:stAR lipid transfer protein 9 [Hymenolepis microstoma]
MARSSSIFVEVENDGYDHTAMSQLLVQVTDLLANPQNEEMSLQLRLSPDIQKTLEREMCQIPEKEQSRQLPTLKEILQVSSTSRKFHSTNTQELQRLESELFTFLSEQRGEKDLDRLVTLHSCLSSRKVKPPYNRLLQLHLQSLLQHPVVQEDEETKSDIIKFIQRLETSPRGIELTAVDADFLLEVITMTNASIFSPVFTPPTIFNHRESPIMLVAMEIANMSVELQKLAESEEIVSDTQKNILEETRNLTAAGMNQSCPTAKFYSRVIPHQERAQLFELVSDLQRDSKSTMNYRMSKDQVTKLSDLGRRLGEISLLCAKFKVAKAYHIVKNRFRLSTTNFQRICVIGKNDQEIIRDALLLINAAGIAKHSEMAGFVNLFNGEFDVELMKTDAEFLEHLLTCGIDFQISPISPWPSTDHSIKSSSIADNKEKIVLPLNSSVVRNPFARSKTPELSNATDSIISTFFDRTDNNTYENDTLIKPTEISSTLTTAVYQDDFKSSLSDVVSTRRTLPPNDAHFYFKLIPETLMLRKSISDMQRSPSQLFASKLAPFQIIQLCDCVRKLSSVEPHSEDAKLIRKLSIEANRHLKFKLKAKTVGRLKTFYHRINEPVLKSGSLQLGRVIEEQKFVPTMDEVNLNAENTFYETEICSSTLFDKTDSLSLFFLESIKNRCMTRSGNTVNLSEAEFSYLSALAQEANAEIEVLKNQVSPGDMQGDNVARLLCLYKMRAIIKTEDSSVSHQVCKRLLWKHILTQFFNFYPEKALKSPFSHVAFNIFIEESDHLSDDIREDTLMDIQSLIEATERTTYFSLEAVNNLLAPKTKRLKVMEALKSKFVVSSMNNRQLNCDPSAVGMWISELESQPNEPLSTFLAKNSVNDVKQFLLMQPETQELNETSLTDKLLFSGSDKNLASFEPSELTKVASQTAGIGQTSPRSHLLYVLLLEALVKKFSQSRIFVNRGVFAEIQGLSNDREVEEAVNETNLMEDAQNYVTTLLLDQNKLVSPQQYEEAVMILQDILSQRPPYLVDLDGLKSRVVYLEKKINVFLKSDNCLLYAIASLRGFQAKLISQNVQHTVQTELVFVLSVAQSYVPKELPLYKEISDQIMQLRHGLVDGSAVDINLQVVERLLLSLDGKLTNNLIKKISECFAQLSVVGSVVDLSLWGTLQFICIAVVMLHVNLEAKLLAILLCRPISALSAETSSTVQAILVQISESLQSSKEINNSKNIRLLSSLLPIALDSADDQPSVEFDKFLITICVANELSKETGEIVNSKLHCKLAEIFWTVFFNQEHLTPLGVFGDFHKWTSVKMSEWLEADQRSSGFFASLFYKAPRFPLDQTRNGQLPIEFQEDSSQMESYFCLLQSLLVVMVFTKFTDSRVLLTKEQLVTLYHAAVICIHSGHFHRRLEAITCLIYLLNRIEKHYSAEVEQIQLESVNFDDPNIQALADSALSGAERGIVENLRSHIAPVILPLGSEAGVPFMSPDPVIVREGLETSLCGYFSISSTDALSAFRIISELQYSKPSTTDLAITCRIINYLFKDDDRRFGNPFGRTSGCVIDLPDGMTPSMAIEAAVNNLNVFSNIGGLKSAKEVEIFLKSLFVLSSNVACKDSGEQLLSEIIVSSPSETYSNYSVKNSNGVDALRSIENSPLFSKISKETSPEDDRTLMDPVQLDVKKLIGRIDGSSDDIIIEDLLDVYHHSRLLLQSGKSNRYSTLILTKIIPLFGCLLPSNEQDLTESQIRVLEEVSLGCQYCLRRRFREFLQNEREELTLKVLYGYFSVRLPTKTSVTVASQRLLALRIARIRRNLSQKEFRSYINDNLLSDTERCNPEMMILAIQAVEKSLENFTLNSVEQICLLYSIPPEDCIMFADLGLAINSMEVWPIHLTFQQRQFLENRLHQWKQTIADLNDFSQMEYMGADDIFMLASVRMFVGAPKNAVLKLINSYSGNGDDPKLRQLRESIEASAEDFDGSVEFLKDKISNGYRDAFVTVNGSDALKLISGLVQISRDTDWLASNQEMVSEACQRLYLAVACNSAVEDKDARIELPRRYLHFHELLPILISRFPKRRSVCTTTDSVRVQSQDFPLPIYESRPISMHSMETIAGSLKSLHSRTVNRGSHLDLDLSGHSTPFKRNSLNHLHELIEIRRAVVAGSKSELNHIEYGLSRSKSEAPKMRCRVPDKLDLSLLRRRCEEHTKHLIRRANYEQEQSELFCSVMHHNLRLTSQRS